jgi:protein-L-isoaspartate(D-aspartate) O-methyltransferase
MAWRCSGISNKALIENLQSSGIIKNKFVANALNSIDRSDFSPIDPYQDSPQSIGFGATISAPHMHAYALEYLKAQALEPNSKVLDIGCGSGYLATAFAHLNPQSKVIGIDYINELVDLSRDNIMKNNKELITSGRIKLLVGNGWEGYPEEGPYNVIHVGAAASKMPQDLLNQLKVYPL